MPITTNNKPRELHALCDLPISEIGQFDYVDDDDIFVPRFFQYRGEWYDTRDCEDIAGYRSPNLREDVADYHGAFSLTMWSAVLFRYVVDNDYHDDYDAVTRHARLGDVGTIYPRVGGARRCRLSGVALQRAATGPG